MPPENQRFALKLRDGTPVCARPLGPGDRKNLATAYQMLSPEARYQRFWTRTGEVIGDRMLDRLLTTDADSHAIWAVIDSSRKYPGMGAASYWRNPNDPTKAEFSCTVLDRDHGRGIGTLLLSLLWLDAYSKGIKEFVGYPMVENHQALGWMIATGGQGEWDGYKAIFRWNLADVSLLPLTPVAGELAERLAALSSRFLG